jgi:outer membrane murein-binding lipoprotein Lpp
MAANDDWAASVLEHLCIIRNDIAKVSAKVDNLAAEVRSLNADLAVLVERQLS